jgi:NhaP-type Na+/H+ or K+/H+ antiporter
MIRNPRLRRSVAIAAVATVILTWTGVAVTLFLFEPNVATRAAILVAAAVLTELMVWVGAAFLGVTLFDRFRLWRRKPRTTPD